MIKRVVHRQLSDWKCFFSNNYYVVLFASLSIGVYLSLSMITKFLQWAEFREGYVLDDWLLSIVPSMDVCIPLFLMTYGSMLIGIFFSFRRPDLALLAMLTTIIIIFLRLITIYLFPLEAPEGIIPLRDIFLESTVYSGTTLTKDLFFSGHTASVFSLSLIVGLRYIRFYLYFATFVVATLLIVQHAHYTVDIIFAIPFSYLAVWLSKLILKNITEFDYSQPDSLMMKSTGAMKPFLSIK